MTKNKSRDWLRGFSGSISGATILLFGALFSISFPSLYKVGYSFMGLGAILVAVSFLRSK